jgi:hypothetical protein
MSHGSHTLYTAIPGSVAEQSKRERLSTLSDPRYKSSKLLDRCPRRAPRPKSPTVLLSCRRLRRCHATSTSKDIKALLSHHYLIEKTRAVKSGIFPSTDQIIQNCKCTVVLVPDNMNPFWDWDDFVVFSFHDQ